MRAILVGWALSASFALLAASQTASAQTPLDGFLTKDRPCEGSAAYQAFAKSLNERYNFDGSRSGRVVIPADLEINFGTPNARKAGDHTHVSVPVSNVVYFGIPVRELNFFFGHSNGINVKSIVFSADLATTRSRLGAMVKKANAKLQREMAEVSGSDADYLKLQRHKAGSELLCDLST